jgi:hypothetical protein
MSLRAGAVLVLVLAPGAARAEFPRGKPAPGFSLRRLDGGRLLLAALRGKVVFLDFWGPA